jgi:hypothetical protein
VGPSGHESLAPVALPQLNVMLARPLTNKLPLGLMGNVALAPEAAWLRSK